MGFLRKTFVHFLSLILLVALLGGAISYSLNWAFSKPAHLETWLSQSHIYDQVAATAVQQAPSSITANVNNQSVSVPLDSATLNQAAASTFSTQLVQSDVNQFLDSNYAWLQGKSSSPDFQIDLSGPENNFGQNVANLLRAKLSALPACNASQLKQFNSSTFDPATAPCLPPTVNLQALDSQVSNEVSGNTSVIGNTSTLTANNLSAGSNSKPYYQTISWLPTAYRWGQKLPYILGGLAILCILGIFFIAEPRRRGRRRLAWVFAEAGVLLVIAWGVIYFLFNKRGLTAFSGLNNNQVEAALNDLARRAATAITTIDLWFGVGYLVLALLVILGLVLSRRRQPKARTAPAPQEAAEPLPARSEPADESPYYPPASPRPQTGQSTGSIPQLRPRTIGTPPVQRGTTPPSSGPPKRPRLIQ